MPQCLTLTDEQARVLVRALDTYVRLGHGDLQEAARLAASGDVAYHGVETAEQRAMRLQYLNQQLGRLNLFFGGKPTTAARPSSFMKRPFGVAAAETLLRTLAAEKNLTRAVD